MSFKTEPRIVDVRVIFMRLGQINTLADQFDGEASLEIEWRDSNVIDVYDSKKHWNPNIYIYNALGELKQQITHTIRKTELGETIVCEQQKLKGAYYETLELNNFPLDVQDLTISITSLRTTNEVLLRPHPQRPSRVNESAFLAKQQWKLFKCVNAIIDTIHDEDTNQQRSMIHVTCHAQRIPTYFHWNGFFLIFIITLFCFSVWAIDPSLPQNRLALMATILLTSISFRSTITSKLPLTSYLTLIDKYSITLIVFDLFCTLYHAIIVAYIPRRALGQQIPWTIMDKQYSSSSSLSTTTTFEAERI
ncbi:unnamed protein product [Rotaria magnacalcarata]